LNSKRLKMNNPRILKLDESYTFSKYFELAYDIGDILADLDCQFDRKNLVLPSIDLGLDLQELFIGLFDLANYVPPNLVRIFKLKPRPFRT
jgi:hypothetical protein